MLRSVVFHLMTARNSAPDMMRLSEEGIIQKELSMQLSLVLMRDIFKHMVLQTVSVKLCFRHNWGR